MNYEEFREYCITLLCWKMSRSTAENLVDWIFPEEYAELYEKKLAESDEFTNYATKVLGG